MSASTAATRTTAGHRRRKSYRASDRVGPAAVIDDRFHLDREIGRGGMGVVYRAVDLTTNDVVAVKVLSPNEDSGSDAHRRFERECEIVAHLRSPYAIRLLGRGTLRSGRPYFVMELLHGSTLREEAAARGRIDVGTVLRWAYEICDAVGEAHAAGIVHRDIKLENLFLTRGRIKVLDFGLAKQTLSSSTLTGPAVLMGTPRFMAPEQFVNARDVDARGDVWSIGVCLYRLLTGRYPFEAPSLARHFELVAKSAPRSMRTIDPTLPSALDAVILRCLAKEPFDRFADARRLASALPAHGEEEDDPFFALTPPMFHRASVTRVFSAVPNQGAEGVTSVER